MLSLTQKIGQSSCIHIDLDFRYPIEISTRQYSKQDLNKLIAVMNNCINDLYEVPKEDINAYVFERKVELFNDAKKYFKRWNSYFISNIVTNTKTQYILRENIIKECNKLELFSKNFKSINNTDDIVDKAVIENSNWMLYGARKAERDPYELTSIIHY